MIDNENSGNRRDDKLLLVATLLLMLSLLFIFFKPSLTGFNTLGETSISHELVLNKTYSVSTTELLSINGTVNSIKIDGNYSGAFKLWINNSGQLFLVAESQDNNNLLTGMDVLNVGSDVNSDSNEATDNADDTIVDTVKDVVTDTNSDTVVSPVIDIPIENISDVVVTDVNITENLTEATNNLTLPVDELNFTKQNFTEWNITEENFTEQNLTIQNLTEDNLTNETMMINETFANETMLNETFVNETLNETVINETTPIAYNPLAEECIDTCVLSLNLTNATLIIELSENSTLSIDSIIYTQETPINDTNITVETIQYPARVGQPVKWIKNVSRATVGEISVNIPASASNITTYKRLDMKHRNVVASEITHLSKNRISGRGAKSINNESTLKVINPETNVEIEYYTEAPLSSESSISENEKEVVVSSDTHYTNVTVNATLPSEVKDTSNILLKWIVNNTADAELYNLSSEELSILNYKGFVEINLPFTAIDSDNNGLYDSIEWVAPHLSNQTFEIIIITKAIHLDENRNYIDDIYDQVKAQDGIWSEVIQNGEYVRVAFEKNLTNQKDITFYARSNDSGIVEVYEKDGSTKIADFGMISSAQWYKVYLTNLVVPQDTFDLKVVNGSVEFDYIIDPDTPPNITYDNNYTVYTFRANGTFSPPAGITSVSVLVVAGGGGGASFSGGGGAGGLIYNSAYAINGSNISVVVGDGGAGSSTSDSGINGLNGVNSIFGNITATGGGGGGSRNAGYVGKAGNNGGSGGGGAPGDSGILGTGGSASPAGQGNNGGYEISFGWGGSGGGGAGAVGGNASGNTAGAGGNGLNYTINGSNVYYAGGGGGGTYSGGGTAAAGGNGGGGNGSKTGNGDAGVVNTGGGGGGSGYQLTGGKGGSGIVIVRFLTAIPDSTYPIFFNYMDNSASLTDSGIGLFNVTINNTNGTVLLEINNTNITATNISGNVFNASYNFTSSGVYIYRWHSWGNGTNHNYNKSGDLSYIVNATIDVSPPIITLISPLDYANLSSTVSFNCTLSDVSGLKNSTLYGNWSGGWHANQTQTTSGLINSTNFTKTIPDGKYIWNCYGCDILNNCGFNSANRTFTVDTVSPSINIVSPSNNSNFSYKNISINYVVSDSNNVQACWYTNSSGAVNYSITNCANLTAQNWSEGMNNITIYANDSVGNINSSSVSFRVDTVPPSINIIYPQAISYYVNVSSLNYTSSEFGNCWYSNNSGLWNSTSAPAGTNFSNIISIEGANAWTVYCNDSLGNLNSTTTTFFKDTSPLIINFTYPTPQNGTTTSNTSIIVNVSIFKSYLQEVRYNWNGTNFTLYNDSLLLMMNFDNISSLGENNTKVVDLSKYGNNGTVNGGAVEISSGKYGGAYNFSSSGSSISLTGIATPSEYTISLWKLFPLPTSADGWRTVIAKTSGNYHHILFDVNGDIGIYNAGFFTSGYNTNSLSGWHHITTTASGSTTLFYIDGVYVGTANSKIVGSDISGIGNYVVGGTQWSGAIDELRIWNRILSSSEIQQVYMSNLQKFNPTQWSLYVNQSKNSTTGLDNGTYTYQVFASDIAGNSSQTEMRYITIGSPANTPPTIAYVQPITAVDPLESSSRIIFINFTVNDVDGNSTINISSAKVVVNNSGLFRNTTQCSGVAINATAQNISCNLSLQYYDSAGTWNINVSIKDNSDAYTQNVSTSFTYNILYAISLNNNLFDFGALNAGDMNKSVGMLQLNNTGNFNYTLIQLKAYNLVNGTDWINVSNFRINITNVSTGVSLINNTYINVTGATLSRSTDSSLGNQSMYLYVDIPIGTAAKKYNPLSDWIFSLS